MQWIRENLFLTCLAGVLVVCIGVAYAVRSGQDTAFDKEDMEPRAKLARRIASLNRSDPVNKAWLQKAQDRLEEVRRQRDEIIGQADDWNKRNYSVLQLQATTDPAGTTIPAFPYDSAAYQKKDLTSKFTNEYRKVLYGTLAKLDLTAWPTQGEIDAKSAGIKKDILDRRIAADNRVKFAGGAPRVAPKKKRRRKGAAPEPVLQTKQPEGVSDEDWGLSRLSDADVQERAINDATEALMIEKAESGIMFISPETLKMISDPKLPGAEVGPEELTVVFPKEIWKSADAPASRLWGAQLNLWITQDILAAIDSTNDQSLRVAGKVLTSTVPNAAIKRIVRINIDENYLMQEKGGDGDNALTGRVTSPEYEVLGYRFEMVMKSAYLPALIRNLVMRGDHTVTDVSIEPLLAGPNDRRYYGTDPVVKVRMVGEVLFRSGWTRKIMPIETLRDRLGNVLRPEDNKRLEQEDR